MMWGRLGGLQEFGERIRARSGHVGLDGLVTMAI